MLDDQRYTRRVTEFKQPGTCLNCHASTYVTMKQLGGGDIFKGFEQINQMTYKEATKQVKHPVACIDCHEPQTMALRITRPAFMEGIRAYKASQGSAELRSEHHGVRAGDAFVRLRPVPRRVLLQRRREAADVSVGGRPDRRCGACLLRQGRAQGLVHKRHRRADVLKAQHPEFEMFNQGVHARSGVACADCHMPYKREGGMKISDHHVRSPMLNINRACQGCHHFPEEEMKSRVERFRRASPKRAMSRWMR